MPQRICAPSKAGPAGAAAARIRAEHDLAVGADVDEQRVALAAADPGRERAGHDVGTDVGADQGEGLDAGFGMER
jgi:hypothetical protein